jgi:hypothetical protein
MRRNLTVTLDEQFIARMDTVCNGVPRGKWLEQAAEQFLLYMESANVVGVVAGDTVTSAIGAAQVGHYRDGKLLATIDVGSDGKLAEPIVSGENDHVVLMQPAVSPKLRSGIKPRPKKGK